MADPLLVVLMVLHVAVAATAFGITLPVGSALKRASGRGREVKSAVATMAARSGQLAGIFGVLTLVTGLVLIFYLGGFAVVSKTIHAAMGIIVVMILHGAFFMRPAGNRILAAVEQDEAAWEAARKRYAMGHGIMSLMWLAILVLMFIKTRA